METDPFVVASALAEAVIAAHDDAAVGHLSAEAQGLLADAYGFARSIVEVTPDG